MADFDFESARETMNGLYHHAADEDDETIQKLLDEGMPQRRKEKKEAGNMD